MTDYCPLLCEILPFDELVRRPDDCIEVLSLTRPGSEFRIRLGGFVRELDSPSRDDGHISLVWSEEMLVGWCRTSKWEEVDSEGGYPMVWDTLECFVREDWRGRGIASLATMAITSSVLYEQGMAVAVFSPAMMMVAKKCGLHPTLFHLSEDQEWVRA